jgi:hypothetical protein
MSPRPTRPRERSSMLRLSLVVIAALSGGAPAHGEEARWDAGAELAVSRLSSLEETAVGLGLRLSFRAHDWLALDAGATFAPADLGAPAFSGSQTELLLGLRVGPRPRPLGGYVALRGGFVRFSDAPGPLACIAIFPPPLSCVVAAGESPLAFQAGAGLEGKVGGRALVRIEVGDRLVRMPGPSLDARREARLEDFWSHELRLSVGAAFLF